MHTAHGGQLARLVGSPVTFVALTATADKAKSKGAETEGIVLVLRKYGQGKEKHFIRRCYYTKGKEKDSLIHKYLDRRRVVSKSLYISTSCRSSTEDGKASIKNDVQNIQNSKYCRYLYPAVDPYMPTPALVPTISKRLCGGARSP